MVEWTLPYWQKSTVDILWSTYSIQYVIQGKAQSKHQGYWKPDLRLKPRLWVAAVEEKVFSFIIIIIIIIIIILGVGVYLVIF